jgi:hypothetical protein
MQTCGEPHQAPQSDRPNNQQGQDDSHLAGAQK